MSEAAARELEVVRAGALTTVQDQGRPGFAHLGVPRSGALDRAAAAAANAAVGNDPAAAVLETTVMGVAVRAVGPCVVAVTGPPAPVAVDGARAAMGQPVTVPDGAVLDVGPAQAGVRSYLAVAGGDRRARRAREPLDRSPVGPRSTPPARRGPAADRAQPRR